MPRDRNPHALVSYIQKAFRPATANRALLAVLRRSLARPPGEDLRAIAALEGVIQRQLNEPDGIRRERARRNAYLVAGLMALAKEEPPNSNEDLGTSLANLVRNRPKSREAVERRLAALLDADTDQLPLRLRSIVQLLQQHGGILPDFSMLLTDLHGWRNPRRFVQRRWLRNFHRTLAHVGEVAPAAENAAISDPAT